jgi:hypothetical protein
LADRLAGQERAVELARMAGRQVEAPSALRERVELLRASRRDRSRMRLVGLAAIAGVLLAAVVRMRFADRR